MPDNQKKNNCDQQLYKGGDTSDIKLLNDVLHKDFSVSCNNFMGNSGVTLIINYLPACICVQDQQQRAIPVKNNMLRDQFCSYAVKFPPNVFFSLF